MSKKTGSLTPEEIERRFDELEAALDAEQRLEMKKTWAGGAELPAASVTGTQKTPHQEVMEDFDRLLKQTPDGKIPLDAHLSPANGTATDKRFFVTPLFERFLAAAAGLADFCPSKTAEQRDIDSKKADYGRWFASSLVPSNNDYRSNSDLVGEALCCVAWGLVRNRAAPKLADALSRFADTKYAEWFETTVKTRWAESYVRKVGEALFECAYDAREHRGGAIKRTPSDFKDRLGTEANKLKKKEDWRADKPELAAHFEECFRVLSELFYTLPRGQQKSFDPNSVFLRHIMELGGDEIREGLATPGEVPPYCSGRRGVPAPFRGALLDRVRKREDLLRRIGVTADGLKSAYKSRDRRRQRSRLKPEDN